MEVAPEPGTMEAQRTEATLAEPSRAKRTRVYKALNLLRQLGELSARVEAVVFEARHLCACKAHQQLAAPRDLPDDMRRAFQHERNRRMEDVINKTAVQVVKHVMSQKFAYVFNQPVDTNTYPDYPKVVKSPMDLGTIKERLEGGRHYKDEKEVWADIALVFSNAMLFNPPGSDVYVMAQTVLEAAADRWDKDMPSRLAAEQAWAAKEEVIRRRTYAETMARHDANAAQQQAVQLVMIMEELGQSINEVKAAASAACEGLTAAEAEQLGAALRSLPAPQLQAAVQLVAVRQPTALQIAPPQPVLDLPGVPARKLVLSLDEYDPLTLRQLQLITAKCAASQQVAPTLAPQPAPPPSAQQPVQQAPAPSAQQAATPAAQQTPPNPAQRPPPPSAQHAIDPSAQRPSLPSTEPPSTPSTQQPANPSPEQAPAPSQQQVPPPAPQEVTPAAGTTTAAAAIAPTDPAARSGSTAAAHGAGLPEQAGPSGVPATRSVEVPKSSVELPMPGAAEAAHQDLVAVPPAEPGPTEKQQSTAMEVDVPAPDHAMNHTGATAGKGAAPTSVAASGAAGEQGVIASSAEAGQAPAPAAAQAGVEPAAGMQPAAPQPPPDTAHAGGSGSSVSLSPFASHSAQSTGAGATQPQLSGREMAAALLMQNAASVQGPMLAGQHGGLNAVPANAPMPPAAPATPFVIQPYNEVAGLRAIPDFLSAGFSGEAAGMAGVSALVGAPWPGLLLGAGVQAGARALVRTGEQQKVQEGYEFNRRAEASRMNQQQLQQQRQRKQQQATQAAAARMRQQPQYDAIPPPPPNMVLSNGTLPSFPAPPLQPPPASAFNTAAGQAGVLNLLPSPHSGPAVTPAKVGIKRKHTATQEGWPGGGNDAADGSGGFNGGFGGGYGTARRGNSPTTTPEAVAGAEAHNDGLGPPSKVARRHSHSHPHQAPQYHHHHPPSPHFMAATNASPAPTPPRLDSHMARHESGLVMGVIGPGPMDASAQPAAPSSTPGGAGAASAAGTGEPQLVAVTPATSNGQPNGLQPTVSQVLNLSQRPSSSLPAGSGGAAGAASGGSGGVVGPSSSTGIASGGRPSQQQPTSANGVLTSMPSSGGPVAVDMTQTQQSAAATGPMATSRLAIPGNSQSQSISLQPMHSQGALPASSAVSAGSHPASATPQAAAASHQPAQSPLTALQTNTAALAAAIQSGNPSLLVMPALRAVQAAGSGGTNAAGGAGTMQQLTQYSALLSALLQQQQQQMNQQQPQQQHQQQQLTPAQQQQLAQAQQQLAQAQQQAAPAQAQQQAQGQAQLRSSPSGALSIHPLSITPLTGMGLNQSVTTSTGPAPRVSSGSGAAGTGGSGSGSGFDMMGPGSLGQQMTMQPGLLQSLLGSMGGGTQGGGGHGAAGPMQGATQGTPGGMPQGSGSMHRSGSGLTHASSGPMQGGGLMQQGSVGSVVQSGGAGPMQGGGGGPLMASMAQLTALQGASTSGGGNQQSLLQNLGMLARAGGTQAVHGQASPQTAGLPLAGQEPTAMLMFFQNLQKQGLNVPNNVIVDILRRHQQQAAAQGEVPIAPGLMQLQAAAGAAGAAGPAPQPGPQAATVQAAGAGQPAAAGSVSQPGSQAAPASEPQPQDAGPQQQGKS